MSRPSPSSRLTQTRALTERHHEELALIQAVSDAANEAVELRAVLAEALEMICEYMGWQLGHALIVEAPDHAGVRLRSLGSWYAEDPALLAVRQGASASPNDPLLIQTLIERSEPLLLSALGDQPAFPRGQLLVSLGLRHYYAVPVMSGDEVVAALEFASRSRHADQELELLLSTIGKTLGRVAEREARDRARDSLRRAELAQEEAEGRASQLQRLTSELRQRNAELDQFAYVASHDLRAPLRGIANLAAWIAEDLDAQLSADTRRHLELMQERIARMEALIRGLLEYSRVGRNAAPEEEVVLDTFLAELRATLDPEAVVDWSVGPLPTLSASPLLLGRVLQNLLSNAIRHANPDQPQVEIYAERETTEAPWRICVRDNGPGIDPRYQERIWKIFQTLEPCDDPQSTGIGLSLVRKLVERRGGEVGVESEPGAGATFWFTWPLQPREEIEHDAPEHRRE